MDRDNYQNKERDLDRDTGENMSDEEAERYNYYGMDFDEEEETEEAPERTDITVREAGKKGGERERELVREGEEEEEKEEKDDGSGREDE